MPLYLQYVELFILSFSALNLLLYERAENFAIYCQLSQKDALRLNFDIQNPSRKNLFIQMYTCTISLIIVINRLLLIITDLRFRSNCFF